MTRIEFIDIISNGSDILFRVHNRGFTILTWREGGPDIGEWDKPATVQQFPDVDSLVDGYIIDGKPLGELTHEIEITEYT